MEDQTTTEPTIETDAQATAVEAAPPPKMPLRFWIAVDTGLMSLDQAMAAWAVAKASGENFNVLG